MKAGFIEPYFEPGAETNERIATEALAALDALEQEARLKRGELGERRYRRVQVPSDVEWTVHKEKPIPEALRRWVLCDCDL